MSIAADIQGPWLSAPLEFFALDLNPIGVASTFNFHADVNQFGADVVWQGVTYYRWPIEATGFEMSSQGVIARPKIKISNLDGQYGSLVRQYGDLVGAKVTRKRTYAKYLDAVNFLAGNPSADPAEDLDDEVFEINQKTLEDSQAGILEFELRAAIDLDGYQIPREIIQATVCRWRPDQTDICAHAAACGKKLTDCHTFFDPNPLPFGGFPGTALVGQ